MPAKKYPVILNTEEKSLLESVVKRGKHNRREIQRAQILLWSDDGKTDLEIAALFGVTPLTVASTRQRWATEKWADKLIELNVIETPISYETVREILKKTNLSLGKKSNGASQQ